MTYDGPSVFLAPFGNEAASENFRRTVRGDVPVEEITGHTERTFDSDRVRLWGTKETVESSWKNVEKGDFLFFYRSGTYEYAAEVVTTEKNEPLGKSVWPNYDESPWICIIYLEEPIQIGLDSSIVHGLAGHDIDYVMGFQPLNEMGIGGLRGKYGSIEELVYGGTERPSDLDIDRQLRTEVPESVFDSLYFPTGQATELTDQINSALNSGKHIIFTGPPGTGKTEIAQLTCEYLADSHPELYSGYEMTTATADWSTFETVGGYMPGEGADGSLSFESGQFLRRFKQASQQRNELLIIDEINRADIDKSFGQLFTLLSGQPVQLPFKKGGEEIEIVPAGEFEGVPDPHQYVVPESWRILATMNTYDKTSLYEMSYAFMRRFSFIYVDVPPIPEDRDERVDLLSEYAETWGLTPSSETLDGVSDIWFVTNNAVENREIGPAIIRDILQHVENSSANTETAITQAVANHIFPQLEGVPQRERIVAQIISSGSVDATRLEELAGDVLQVNLNE